MYTYIPKHKGWGGLNKEQHFLTDTLERNQWRKNKDSCEE